MRKIKLSLLIISIVCFLAYGITVNAAQNEWEPIIINTDPGEVKPIISVVPDTAIPEITAGTRAALTLPIQNNSSFNAKNVVITLDSGGKSDFPFLSDELGLSKKFDKINSKQIVNAVFELDVDEYAAEGRHLIKLNYTYSNTMGNEYSTSELISIKIINKNTPPKLTVSNMSFGAESVVPGQQVFLNIKLKNMGTLDAKDIKVTLLGLKNDEFAVNNFTDVKYLPDVKGLGTTVVSYDLTASKDISDGKHSLEVKIEYKDSKKNAYTETNQIFIPVTGKVQEGKPSIVLEDIVYPVEMIKPGSDFPISLNVTNKGAGKAENLKLWLTADKEIISKSLSTIMIDALDKGQTKKINFSLSAVSDAATKNYPIGINIEYDKIDGDKTEKVSLTQYIGVYIESETVNKSVPKIIINRYVYEPSEVKAGDNFKLNLSFVNTNRSIATNNIKISVTSDDGTFQPVDTSSTFYVETLGPKSTANKTLTFSTKSDVAPKPYLLTINYEYEDDKGNPYTAKDIISIPVTQVPRLVTGEITVSPEAFAGQPAPVTAEFFNMGKSTLYNLMIKAEGDFDIQGSGYFVGNFEPGKSDVFDTTIVPKAAGQSKGNIVFSFEDASGKQTSIKKEFTMNVIDMPQQGGMDGGMQGNMAPEKGSGKSIKPIYLAAGGIGAALITLIFIIVLRRKIKSRKEMTLDE